MNYGNLTETKKFILGSKKLFSSCLLLNTKLYKWYWDWPLQQDLFKRQESTSFTMYVLSPLPLPVVAFNKAQLLTIIITCRCSAPSPNESPTYVITSFCITNIFNLERRISRPDLNASSFRGSNICPPHMEQRIIKQATIEDLRPLLNGCES